MSVTDGKRPLGRDATEPLVGPATPSGTINPPATPSTDDLREQLGRHVRQVWVDWAREQPNPKPSWLVPWEGLSESDREVDRRIGEALYSRGRGVVAPLLAAKEAEIGRRKREIAALSGRPTTDAYEGACEALERRRVALVKALSASEGTAFYDAVARVAELTRERDLWKGNWEKAQRGNTMLLEKFAGVVELPEDWRRQLREKIDGRAAVDVWSSQCDLIASWAGRPAAQEAPEAGDRDA